VRWTKNTINPWTASAGDENGKWRSLGAFGTQEEAAAARRAYLRNRKRPLRRVRWTSASSIYDDDRDYFLVELTQGRWAMVDVADMSL
jgi:hypothetical protein